MRKGTLLALATMLSLTIAAQRFTSYTELLDSILVSPGHYEPLPRATENWWRDSLPEDMRRSYILEGERMLGKSWSALPLSVFAEFKENGNRVNYEELCFDKRRQLAVLAMAEIAEGKGRFLNAVADGLQSLCEETWWGIPAHYKYKVPVAGEQTVDLFNAETANLVAWTTYMLRPLLDRRFPQLGKRIDQELQRRILTPARKNDYWWKTAGMNWNPWICSNWLACVLLAENDRQRQLEAVGQILRSMDTFVDSYKDDGGCDEGPGYWDRAGASLYECMNLLYQATGGHVDLRGNRKIKAMAAYIYKTYIGQGYVLNFADSHGNRNMQHPNIVYPFGHFIGDKTMKRFARYMADEKDLTHQAGRCYASEGNFPSLSRELFFLRQWGDLQQEHAEEPRLKNVWLGDLQIWACRPSGGRLYVAMKGGNNGESHNHNDVGQLLLYADGQPVLIDPGVGEYTSKTFSNQRYSIWTMQSDYHNLPLINGRSQRDGKQYGARMVRQQTDALTLDLAGAYPQEAAVRKWLRQVQVSRKGTVSITESYELDDYKAPTQLVFMTTREPVCGQGTIRIGDVQLCYDCRQLTADAEDISTRLDPLLRGMWGEKMYRIVLTVLSKERKGTIRYTVK